MKLIYFIASLILLLTSACQEPIKLQSIAGSRDYYCGLNTENKPQCFRYLTTYDLQRKVIPGLPVLDNLLVPKEVRDKSYHYIKVTAAKNIYGDTSHVLACGFSQENKPLACWTYVGPGALLKLLDLGSIEGLPGSDLVDIGSVADLGSSPTVAQLAALCFAKSGSSLLTCIDPYENVRLSINATKISQIAVGNMVCFQSDGKTSCSKLAYENGTKKWQLSDTVEFATTFKKKPKQFVSLVIPGYPVGGICLIDDESKVYYCGASINSLKAELNIEYIKNLEIKQIANLFAIDRNNLLHQFGFDYGAYKIIDESFPPVITSKRFASFAGGFHTACGIEKGTTSVSCYQMDEGKLTDKAIPSPVN